VELRGKLTATELAEIFQLLITSRKEGTLAVTDGENRKQIYFSPKGVTLLREGEKGSRAIGQLLIETGRLTEEELKIALQRHAESGKRLGEVVCAMGYVTMDEIEALVRRQIEEEILDLLSWRSGRFQFNDGPPPAFAPDSEYSRTTLMFDPNSLLMEAARRFDEWQLIEQLIKTEGEVFKRVEGVEPRVDEDLADIARQVLPLVDGLRTAADIAEQTGLSKFEVYSTLYQLHASGAVVSVEPEELNRRAEGMVEHNPAEAIRLLESAWMQEPDNLEFCTNLAKAHEAAGHRKEALDLYARIARAWLARDAFEEAEQVLERVRRVFAGSPTTLALDVALALGRGNIIDAIAEWQELLRVSERHKDYEEARALAEPMLRAGTNQPEVRESVADLLARVGETKEAIEEYKQIAEMFLNQGKPKRALGVYQRILELDPWDPEATDGVDELVVVTAPRPSLTRRVAWILVASVAAMMGLWWLLSRGGALPTDTVGTVDSQTPVQTGPGSGVAPPPGDVTPAPAKLVQEEVFAQTRRFEAAGRFSEAVNLLSRAIAGETDPAILTQYRLRRQRLQDLLASARAQFDRARALEEAGDLKRAREEYLALCVRHEFALTEFDLKLPVAISSLPVGAQVLVDGRPVGETPAVIHLPPFKEFRIILRAPNHKPFSSTLTSDATGEIEAVLPREALWSYRSDRGMTVGPGGGGGRVFLSAVDGSLRALNEADGSELWKRDLDAAATTHPVVAGAVVVVAGADGAVRGLSAANGQERWRFQTGDVVKGAPEYVEALKLLFVSGLDKNIYCLNPLTGAEQWRFTTSGNVEAGPTAVGTMVVCGSLDGWVYALTGRTGALLWSTEVGGPVAEAVTFDEQRVFVVDLRGQVLACDRDRGQVLWRHRPSEQLVTPVYPAGGTVSFATETGAVIGLAVATGEQRWLSEQPVGGPVTELRSDGSVLWVGGQNGRLVCLDGATGTPQWQTRVEGALTLPFWVGRDRLSVATTRGIWCFLR